MNKYLDDTHIFMKNPKRAADFFSFAWSLLADKPSPDYQQLKEIIAELKRLPDPYKFDFHIALEEADKWQKYFPGVDIPKVIAGYGSKIRDKQNAKKIYNHYALMWNDLNKAEKTQDYPRFNRQHKQQIIQRDEETPKPIRDENHPPGWQLAKLSEIIKEHTHKNLFEMEPAS